MRIEKVSIYNINSLAGRFEIDFTDGKYSEGLFAITGPSGAGKTTVLDSICLALYGKTPRIDSISETQDEIMSKNRDECSAEAVFVSRGNRYKASFSHKRAGGEKPYRQVKREITEYLPDGSSKIIASMIKEASEKIVEITGLTYSQFTRSIMLAQFQFAKFLESDSNDRAAILEQVSDMGIYREISAAVYERAKRERTSLDEIRIKIQSLPVMDEAQIKQLENERESLNFSIASHKNLRDSFAACRDSALKLQKLKRELEGYKKDSGILNSALAVKTELFQKAEKDEQDSKQELIDLQNTLKTVRELDGKIALQNAAIEKLDSDITENGNKINAHKRGILKVFKTYLPSASGEELKSLYESSEPGDILRGGLKEKLDAVGKQEAELREASKKALLGRDEAYWQRRNDTLKIILPIAEAQAEADRSANELELKNEEQKELLKTEESLKAELRTAEERLVYAKLEEKFGEEREKLEDGKPCPLCGAEHHPFAGQAKDSAYLKEAVAKKEEFQNKDTEMQRKLADSRKLILDLNKTVLEKTAFIKDKTEEAKRSEIDAIEALNEYGGDPEKLRYSFSETENIIRDHYASITRLNTLAGEAIALTSRLSEIEKDVSEILASKRNIKGFELEAEEKQKLKDGELKVREQFLSQRRGLFGDKNTDDEERKANEKSEDARRIKEERRQSKEKAERDFEQNKKDIIRTEGSIDSESRIFGDIYSKTKTDAQSLTQPLSSNAEIILFFEKFKAGVSSLGESAPSDLNVFTVMIGSLDSLFSAENQRQGALNQIIKNNDINKDSLAALKKDEAKQIISCAKWDRLNALIGSAEGDKFSRMAQGYTFEALLRYANSCLKRMTDRYILVRDTSNGTKPLELCVADNYQAGDTRPVSNLSGGESFIVSMALALGMSEMSSGKTRIDSLFIDEGFASLDDEYLEAALQTLSSLGNREGKLVGVISHVGALKERIETQIEVKKLSGGRSTLLGPGVTAIGE